MCFMVLKGKEMRFEEKRVKEGKTEVRPPKVVEFVPPKARFGRRTWLSCGCMFGCRKWLTKPPIKAP